MHARLQHDNDVITSAFRLGNSGLDSELKQGHRCVSEHAYEETVIRPSHPDFSRLIMENTEHGKKESVK